MTPTTEGAPADVRPLLPRLGSSIWVLVAAWALSRAYLIGAVTGTAPYPDGELVINDVRLYAEWSNLLVTGRFPIGDDMWQYPPAAGIIFALSAVIGPQPVLGFLALGLLADAAVLAILVVAGRRRAQGLTAGWAWVIGGLLVGPVFVARFDVFPTLAAVAALVLVARPVASGAAVAVGALLKVWPVFMLLALPRRSILKGGIGFVAAAVVLLGGISLWATGGVSFLGEQGARGLQVESVGAWPFIAVQVFGVEIPKEFRFGAMELDIPITIPLGLAITVTGFAIIAGLGIARLLGRLERVPPADVALVALLVSIVTSRVLSPQYSVWIVGVAAVVLLDPRTRLRGPIALLVPSILVTQVIYPFGYGSMLDGAWWAVGLQSVRIMLLLAATGWALATVVAAIRRSPEGGDALQHSGMRKDE